MYLFFVHQTHLTKYCRPFDKLNFNILIGKLNKIIKKYNTILKFL